MTKLPRQHGRVGRRTERLLLLGGVCGLVLIMPIANLNAAEWSTGVSGSATTIFDDNIRLSDTNEESDFGVIVRPQLDITGRAPTWDVGLGLELRVARYVEDSTLDAEDLRLSLDTRYRTQLSEFRLNGEASRTSTQVTEETDSGNFRTTTDRDLLRLSPSWLYTLTQRDKLRLGAGWTEVDYKSDDFTDYRTLNAEAGWIREITTSDILSFSFVVDHSESQSTVDLDSDVYGALVGWEHTVSERLKTTLEAGPQYYTTDTLETVNGSPQIDQESDLGFRVTAGIDYDASEVTSFRARVSRRIEPSSGGSPLERTFLDASATHQFQPRLRGTLRTYFQFESDPVAETSSDTQRNFLIVEPQVIYELTMNWDVAAGYRFRTQESAGNDRAYSNAIFATLTYRPPL